MNLKCRINGKDYDSKVVQGLTFSDDYGETLDSGSIILSHVNYIEDLKPYDDVYIYEEGFDIDKKNIKRSESLVWYEMTDVKTIDNKTTGVKETYKELLIIFDDDFKNFIKDNQNGYIQIKPIMFGPYGNNFFDIQNMGEYLYITPMAGSDKELSSTIAKIEDDRLVARIKIFDTEYSPSFYNARMYYACNEIQKTDKFYKHLLVDQFTEEIINLEEGIYKYKIELFSETKGLEVVQCPNSSVTEPLLFNKKISIYEYICKYLYLYSPVVKVRTFVTEDGTKRWQYKLKYNVSKEVKDKFSNVYCQDFTLTNPNLREILTELFITLDLIPIIKDNVLYYLDKTQRKGFFHNCDQGIKELNSYVNYITGSLSSDNYTDNLRRPYQNAILNKHSCKTIEYIGFRNSNSSLLTLDGLRIETKYPIYKINKIKLCYYKDVQIAVTTDKNSVRKQFLCKQDITPFLKLNSERNLLKQDWKEFTQIDIDKMLIYDLTKYKFATIGYDIGSNFISGWGEKYTYAKGFWDYTATYIENIFKICDYKNPYGEMGLDGLIKLTGSNSLYVERADVAIGGNPFDVISNEYITIENENLNNDKLFDSAAKIKSLFFEIEYEAMYNGAVIHSKDGGRDNICFSDGSNSALSLLEKDGIAQKEKINSLGNKTISFNARYPGNRVDLLQELGSIYESKNEKDIIIYHREYSIYDNFISCSYIGAKDYVLKNFFTSVYAKHRPNKLMSYSESISRSENKKFTILLSKDKLYYENNKNSICSFYNLNNKYEKDETGEFVDTGTPQNIIQHLLNVFSTSQGLLSIKNGVKNFESKNKINYAVFSYNDKYYVSDLASFVCGHSICFGIQIPDNITAGIYIKDLIPSDVTTLGKISNAVTNATKNPEDGSAFSYFVYSVLTDKNSYTGALQDWYFIADEDTGNGDTYGFFFGHRDYNQLLPLLSGDAPDLKPETFLDKIKSLPLIENFDINKNLTNIIGNNYLMLKDNKEVLNLTIQFEFTQDYNTDVYFSSWLCKLSELVGAYYKNTKDIEQNIVTEENLRISWNLIAAVDKTGRPGAYTNKPYNYSLPMFTTVLTNSLFKQFEGEDFGFIDFGLENNLEIEFSFAADRSLIMEDLGFASNSATGVEGWEYITKLKIKPYGIRKFTGPQININTGETVFAPFYLLESDIDVYVSEYELIDNVYYLTLSETPTFTYKHNPESNKYSGILLFLTDEENGKVVLKSGTDNSEFAAYRFEGNDVYINNVPGYILEQNLYKNPSENINFVIDRLFGYNSSNEKYRTYLFEITSKITTVFNPSFDDETYENTLNQFGAENIKTINEEESTYEEANRTMLVTTSQYDINQDIEYMKIQNFDNSIYNIIDKDVDAIFSVESNYININLSGLNNISSIQYWFYDEESKCYHFVFGANVSKDDLDKGNIKIYTSLVSSKDERVFDANGQLTGVIHNYLNDDPNVVFGSGQYYDKIL